MHSVGRHKVNDRRTHVQTTGQTDIMSRAPVGGDGIISLRKVIWEEGRVAALSHTYAVKSPLVTMARPKFPPKSTLPWTDRQTLPPVSSLDPSDLRCQTAFGSDPPFFQNALDRPTDGPTDRQIVHGKV